MYAQVRLSMETRLIVVIIRSFVIVRDRPRANTWNALAHIVAPYRWLLWTSRQSLGTLLMAYPKSDSFSYSERVTNTVCPRMVHLVVFNATLSTGTNHSIRDRSNRAFLLKSSLVVSQTSVSKSGFCPTLTDPACRSASSAGCSHWSGVRCPSRHCPSVNWSRQAIQVGHTALRTEVHSHRTTAQIPVDNWLTDRVSVRRHTI